MNCFHCDGSIEIKHQERIGFRDRCVTCDRPLHVCFNCSFHDPSFNNQCREAQADRVVDKDRVNFCDYFTPRSGGSKPVATGSDARAKLDALFPKKVKN